MPKKKPADDIEFIKYGLLLKCYDRGAGKWSEGYCPPVLAGDLVISFPRWIYGGAQGTDFIMAPVDHQSTREQSDQTIRI